MEEITEFSSAELEENSLINGIEDHTLKLKVSLDNTSTSFKYGSELNSLKEISSILPPKLKRSSSTSSNQNPKRHRSELSHSQFKNSVLDESSILNTSNLAEKDYVTPKKSRPDLPKSSSSNAYKLIAKKFDTNFSKFIVSENIPEPFTKEDLVRLLFSMHFLDELKETSDFVELFNLVNKCNTHNYLKSVLQGILKINTSDSVLSNEEFLSIKNRFPIMYANYFKSKRKLSQVEQPSFSPQMSPQASFSYKIVKKPSSIQHKDQFSSLAEYLMSYQKTLEDKFERSAEKINKEKYKECTFKPKINKKSKAIDSSPSALKLKNSSSYKVIKDSRQSTPRTEALYEFAKVASSTKKANIEQKINEELSRYTYSPIVRPMKSKENTPVKGMDDAVKRLQKARVEKEWKQNMMERGKVIAPKDKENIKKTVDKIADINITLPNGTVDKITYSKGENLNYLVNEFCTKHKLAEGYHEKLVKIVLRNLKGRESS
ncbi:hypothetical protein SteCoe_9785 [Stentor coeruleus]|uniref:Uncharacterized protein n=1 Tax=Stentor coeruleus TaxID=5963 RepID=A0A1R2CH13_9CILI|nr:hypothetical protein SteCoe_9785 [Stentor coeruleus]